MSAVAEDDREQVVEVVGHAAGELAQRLEPLGLPQLALEPLAFLLGEHPLGDVAQDALDRDDRPSSVADADRPLLESRPARRRGGASARSAAAGSGEPPGRLERGPVVRLDQREHQLGVGVQLLRASSR